jgi:predicted nucleic acid-binding protein
MIVVDASVILEVLLVTPASPPIRERLFSAGQTLHAPHLLDLEVAQVLRRYCLSGQLGPKRGLQALRDLADFPLTRYPHDLFLPRIWQLRHDVTACDAAYLALAEALPAPLLTRDTSLASSSGHTAKIELV